MNIGFIGLGNVGAKLAGSLLRNGFDLTVRDLNAGAAEHLLQQGAAWADSGAGLARKCDAIITCLPSPAAVSDVMEAEDGVIAGITPGKLWLEMSTIDPDVTVAIRIVESSVDIKISTAPSRMT